MPLNPDLPPPTTPEKVVAALSRSREVVIFAAGVVLGVLAVLVGRIT